MLFTSTHAFHFYPCFSILLGDSQDQHLTIAAAAADPESSLATRGNLGRIAGNWGGDRLTGGHGSRLAREATLS